MAHKNTYVAFLRGINVGGNHKVPMAELKLALEQLNFKNCVTILNSGNVIFESSEPVNQNEVTNHLEKTFGFPIPTVIKSAQSIIELHKTKPFGTIDKDNKTIKNYVSLLWKNSSLELTLPWKNDDGSFQILKCKDAIIFSTINTSVIQTTKGMEALEKFYGKEMTTRNWNTIERIIKKLN